IMVDERGKIIDGDQVIGLITQSWSAGGQLQGGGVVTTVMSNLGLERFLGGLGVAMHRTQVGDRYVVEQMRARGCNVGGEQSGHIILSDYATTGDGVIAALQVLAATVQSRRPASAVTRLFDPLPQLLKNVRVNGGHPLDAAGVKRAIHDAETRLGR